MSFKKVTVRIKSYRYFFTCDLCGTEWGSSWREDGKCEICGRDVCPKCRKIDYQTESGAKDFLYEYIDGEREEVESVHLRKELSNFPTNFCKECWSVYEPYQKQILKIFEKYPIAIGNIVKKFKKKRLAELNLLKETEKE